MKTITDETITAVTIPHVTTTDEAVTDETITDEPSVPSLMYVAIDFFSIGCSLICLLSDDFSLTVAVGVSPCWWVCPPAGGWVLVIH